VPVNLPLNEISPALIAHGGILEQRFNEWRPNHNAQTVAFFAPFVAATGEFVLPLQVRAHVPQKLVCPACRRLAPRLVGFRSHRYRFKLRGSRLWSGGRSRRMGNRKESP
jgi:hypothetical protein